jgi:hypothetical protein
MLIEKSLSGYWIISNIIDGYLVTRKYSGYTKKQAIKLFKLESES